MSLENYESVLADLETRRDQIDQAIQAIKLIMGAGGELSSGASSGTQRAIAPQSVPAGAFHRLSLVEATKKYLDMVKTNQSTNQIIKALEQGGLPPTKYTTLYAVLRRRQSQFGDIVKMGDDWALREWNPNHPSIKKLAEGAGTSKKKKKKKAKKIRAAASTAKAAPDPGPVLKSGEDTDEMSLGDAAEKVLLAEGKAMHVNALKAGVAAFGKTPTRDTIAKNLPRDAKHRFVRTGPGTFDLTERADIIATENEAVT